MSLNIECDDVTHVLLADGWHTVADNSFAMDAYEYHWHDVPTLGGGQSGICATGFEFLERSTGDEFLMAGPMTSVLAIRHRRRAE